MTPLPSPTDYSRYLARLVQARPEFQADLDAPVVVDAATLASWLAATPLTEDNLKPALRRIKQKALANIASRDLAGLADLGEVVESMTLVADAAVAAALAVVEAGLVARDGAPRNANRERQQLIVVGMGKLGGRELNVSSDIDLIFVYPDDGDTDGSRSISNFEFFSRLGRGLINALAEITGEFAIKFIVLRAGVYTPLIPQSAQAGGLRGIADLRGVSAGGSVHATANPTAALQASLTADPIVRGDAEAS